MANQKIQTFLMFNGRAEEAMNYYIELFPGSGIEYLRHYEPNEGGVAGSVMQAVFKLAGQYYMCIDNNSTPGFGFTPATSLFVHCADQEELEQLFSALSEGGQVLMPLDKYPFSEGFAWVSDKFGVSWQLNLGSHKTGD